MFSNFLGPIYNNKKMIKLSLMTSHISIMTRVLVINSCMYLKISTSGWPKLMYKGL